MKWILENWSVLVVIALLIFFGIKYLLYFASLGSDEQVKKIREWALAVVIEMEKQYGSKTGSLKLSAAYSLFFKSFPELVTIISFEQFSEIIDDALAQMRHLLETNKEVASYVYDKK